jgi:hypothetical protein
MSFKPGNQVTGEKKNGKKKKKKNEVNTAAKWEFKALKIVSKKIIIINCFKDFPFQFQKKELITKHYKHKGHFYSHAYFVVIFNLLLWGHGGNFIKFN